MLKGQEPSSLLHVATPPGDPTLYKETSYEENKDDLPQKLNQGSERYYPPEIAGSQLPASLNYTAHSEERKGTGVPLWHLVEGHLHTILGLDRLRRTVPSQ